MDLAIAEITDQQVVSKGAKSAGRQGESPRRVERVACACIDEPLDEVPVQVEYVDKPVPRTGDIVCLAASCSA